VALGEKDLPVPGFKRLAEMGQHLSGRERVAMEAERECQKRYVCMVLAPQVGRVFPGIVSGITEYGFWVELPEVIAEGLIRLANMQDDYYGYLKEREMLVGQRTGKVIRAGQAVRVRLVNVSLDRLEIDLELAPAEKGDAPDQTASALERGDMREAQDRKPRRTGARPASGRGADRRAGRGEGRKPGRPAKGSAPGKPSSGKPATGKPSSGKPATGKPGPGKPVGKSDSGKPTGKPARRRSR